MISDAGGNGKGGGGEVLKGTGRVMFVEACY
jgi:hypothetical protein